MERFWSKVKMSNSEKCWEWQAGRSWAGYGDFSMGRKRKHIIASRFAWELTNGPVPKGKCVLHTCDNPPCCNPAHLFLGSRKQNSEDCKAKGRNNKGERHGNAKFTEKDVIKIRKLYAAGRYRQEDLAKKFGVERRAIGRVIDGTRWGHVGPA